MLLELKASKRTIGFYEGPVEFFTVELQLKKSDVVYLFSDGYADQFGGDGTKASGKKLKSGNFRNVLFEGAALPLNKQKDNLQDYLSNWQGNFAQVDDITVIAFQI